MPFCDIGLNLTNNRFLDDQQAVLERAITADVTKFIITGTDLEESEMALSLSHKFPESCYATAGVHPHYAKSAPDDLADQLTALAAQSKIVAIGECGLDFNRNYSPQEDQLQVFEIQLQVAHKTGLPLFLHERDAFQEQVGLLKQYLPGIKGGVAHCFTGTQEQMHQYLELGLYIGITGWLCDAKRGKELRQAVESLPLSRLLLETDAPYLTPKTLKQASRRNEPENLPHIAGEVARIKNCTLEEIAEASFSNSLALFSI